MVSLVFEYCVVVSLLMLCRQPIPCEIAEETVFEFFDYQGQLDAAVAAAASAMALEALVRNGLGEQGLVGQGLGGQGQGLGGDEGRGGGGEGEGEAKEKAEVGHAAAQGLVDSDDDLRGGGAVGVGPPTDGSIDDATTNTATTTGSDGEEVSIVTMRPMVPLEPDRYYAVLLANGAPLVPQENCMMGRGDLFAFAAGNTTEDLLIVFKTTEMR